MVGLVRHHSWNPMQLDRDHQVLAYAYEADGPGGEITIRLYDPNWPNRDDVTLHLSSTGSGSRPGSRSWACCRCADPSARWLPQCAEPRLAPTPLTRTIAGRIVKSSYD